MKLSLALVASVNWITLPAYSENSTALSSGTQTALTLQARIQCQRAIEEVYWRHRIWPAANRKPKPELGQVMPEAALRAKVEGYLEKSNALALYGQRLRAEQLQADMERMAQHTQKPQWLAELWAALGSDPYVIAECLVRSIVADELLRKWHAEHIRNSGPAATFETWWAESKRTLTVVTDTPVAEYQLPAIGTGPSGCADDTWTTIAPARGRVRHTVIWTGAEMIVWGGVDWQTYLNTGDRYDPATDSWTAISTLNAPSGRWGQTAIWTGAEMIVWGGYGGVVLNSGGRYDSATDTWVQTSLIGAPSRRYAHTAVWTGTEMIIWGGGYFPELNTGGRYSRESDAWVATSTNNAPSARNNHSAVWTDTEMIIWGGYNGGYPNSGSRYDPLADTWVETNRIGAPSGRRGPRAIWTGTEVIVWGGSVSSTETVNTGGRYDPLLDGWSATDTMNAPTGRLGHTAVWTGSEMIVWGGYYPYIGTGGRYNPASDAWRATSLVGAPSGRDGHSAVWTGTEMLIWSGEDHCDEEDCHPTATGGRYCANSPL